MAAGQATQLKDGSYEVRHADGSVETLSEKQFHAQYPDDEKEEQPVGAPDPGPDERSEIVTQAKANRPETNDGERFSEPVDHVKDYIERVEAELKAYEEGIKAVRAEIKALKGQKDDEHDFGPIRRAIHELAHGKSLARTAHPATVPHDGPERLREAPTPETNYNSGPGEELNPENAAHGHYEGRVVGK